MKVLIAEDGAVSRRLLERLIGGWGYEVVVTVDGAQAWEILSGPEGPGLAVIDWMMPVIDGVELCRRARLDPRTRSTHIIMLTARGNRKDIVAGLQAGADDYVIKPFDHAELQARLQVGARIVSLQASLVDHARNLEEALQNVRVLSGFLPICAYCKKIRDDKNYWQQVESYVAQRSDAQFSHSICPECYKKHLPTELRGGR
jgi:phosphoserine phosphatase RsbU/P